MSSNEVARRPWRAAGSGILAVAVALGCAELAAGLLPGARSLVIAIGDAVIDSVPGWLERAAISTLGTADKPVLLISILLGAGALGAGVGIAGARRFLAGAVALAALTAVAVAAALADPQARAASSIAIGLVAALCGIAALRLLLRAATEHRSRPVPVIAAPGAGGADRRAFLRASALAAVAAGVSGLGGRLLTGRERIAEIRRAIRLPRPARAAPPPPSGADLEIPGVAPLYVPNDRFYRIDTALIVPQVDPSDWTLAVKGRVERPFTLTYDELLRMPQIEADITLSCVSNEVGGDLVGNARWQGVPLHVLLERAGVQAGATQLVGRSVDGFTAGFPTRMALDVKETMVAVAMNGEPLPAEHGFPARLVVPGLYGYVSATKWLSAIELKRWDEFDGYWIPRGWAKRGPIKTQSRIDVPAPSSTVPAGRRPIAGVAWAPTRGIRRVEVSIDDGPWQDATLASALNADCWRQWMLSWNATSGRHTIAVRATDGPGVVQTDTRTPVAPDGASGHHTIEVDVT